MNRLYAVLVLLAMCGQAAAQAAGGVKQADGSTVYTLRFGTIVEKPSGRLAMTLNGARDWLAIGAAGFKIDEMNSKDGGIMLVTAVNPDGVMMSAYFERVDQVTSASDCREFYFAYLLANPPKEENIRRDSDGERSLVAYTLVQTVADLKLTQQHRNVYLFGGGHCADVHLSKVGYEPAKDDAVFERITRSILLVPAP